MALTQDALVRLKRKQQHNNPYPDWDESEEEQADPDCYLSGPRRCPAAKRRRCGVKPRQYVYAVVKREAAPPPSVTTDEMNLLVQKLHRLRIRSLLDLLPNELLLCILNHLGPEPVALSFSPRVSLQGRTWYGIEHWTGFFQARADILSLCRVNKRLNALATPLLYRNIFLSRPTSLVGLLANCVERPSLGRAVRHINCSISLGKDTQAETVQAWNTVSMERLAHLDLDPSRPPTFKKLSYWFTAFLIGRGKSDQLTVAIFNTLLTLTNRLEGLALLLSAPDRSQAPRSVLWNWLLDEANPFADAPYSFPKVITAGTPTRQDLETTPCWPPPFLRDITVELDCYGEGANFIHLEVVPLADGLAAASKLQASALAMPTKVFNSSAIRSLSAHGHINLSSYLDSLKRISDVEHSIRDLDAHIENLKSLIYSPTPDEIDNEAARELSQVLHHLPLRWSPRLSVRRKRLEFTLSDFISSNSATSPRWVELAINVSNVESLKLMGEPSFVKPLPVQAVYLQPRLLRSQTPFSSLKELQLYLRLDKTQSATVYGRQGRLRNLVNLGSLKSLVIPLEALFGPRRQLVQQFNLRDLVASPPAGPLPVGQTVGQIISELPPHLEELQLVDWYHQYHSWARECAIHSSTPTDGVVQGAGGTASTSRLGSPADWKPGCVGRLEELQKLIVAALTNLASVLQEERPSIKRVIFRVNDWDSEDMRKVWLDWAKGKRGVRQLKKVYKEGKMTLRVVQNAQGKAD